MLSGLMILIIIFVIILIKNMLNYDYDIIYTQEAETFKETISKYNLITTIVKNGWYIKIKWSSIILTEEWKTEFNKTFNSDIDIFMQENNIKNILYIDNNVIEFTKDERYLWKKVSIVYSDTWWLAEEWSRIKFWAVGKVINENRIVVGKYIRPTMKCLECVDELELEKISTIKWYKE